MTLKPTTTAIILCANPNAKKAKNHKILQLGKGARAKPFAQRMLSFGFSDRHGVQQTSCCLVSHRHLLHRYNTVFFSKTNLRERKKVKMIYDIKSARYDLEYCN